MFYVYAYLRKDNSPYYIGKGTKYRAYDKDHNVPVPKDKSRIVFLETNLSNIGALALERRMIRWYGRKDNGTGILRNMTDGGEGSSGYRHTIAAREKISSSQLGKSRGPCKEETRIKISKSHIGEAKTEEHRSNIAKSMCGELNPNFGLKRNEETREKMSAWQTANKDIRAAESRARWQDPVYRAMMLEARKVKKKASEDAFKG